MMHVLVTVLALMIAEGATAQVDCASLKTEIEKGIEDANGCWEDQDCRTFDYGCPWQLAYCHRYLTGKDDGPARKKVLAKISRYSKECVMPNAYLSEQCARYDEAKKTLQCPDDLVLHCVNGRCVTQTEVIMHDATPTQDVYGSRKIIIPSLNIEEKKPEADAASH